RDRDRTRRPADDDRADRRDGLARAERVQREAGAAAEREEEHPEPKRRERSPAERGIVTVCPVIGIFASEQERRDEQGYASCNCEEVDVVHSVASTDPMP